MAKEQISPPSKRFARGVNQQTLLMKPAEDWEQKSRDVRETIGTASEEEALWVKLDLEMVNLVEGNTPVWRIPFYCLREMKGDSGPSEEMIAILIGYTEGPVLK